MVLLKFVYPFLAILFVIIFSKNVAVAFSGNESLGTSNYPPLYVTLTGNPTTNVLPGFGILDPDSFVIETGRMTAIESNNSYSAFGITRNSSGEYWTSAANAIIQFDPISGKVIKSYVRVGEPFLNIVFDSSDRLLGWSNSNGYLYEITLRNTSYTETPLFYIGLYAGGLTEMEFSSEGILFGVDQRNKRIITIDLQDRNLSTVVNLSWGSYIGLAIAPDDTLFITNSITNTLLQFDKFGRELNRQTYVTSSPIMGLEFAQLDSPIPEPSTLFLIGAGLVSVSILTRKIKK